MTFYPIQTDSFYNFISNQFITKKNKSAKKERPAEMPDARFILYCHAVICLSSCGDGFTSAEQTLEEECNLLEQSNYHSHYSCNERKLFGAVSACIEQCLKVLHKVIRTERLEQVGYAEVNLPESVAEIIRDRNKERDKLKQESHNFIGYLVVVGGLVKERKDVGKKG